MTILRVVPLVVSVFVFASCQQPLDDLSEISPYLPSTSLERNLLQQCEGLAQTLSEENERLKIEIQVLRRKIEEMEEEEDEEEEEEEEDDKEGSNESEDRGRGLRSRRGAAGCDGGTLAAWACAPQCIFKLKGLCGLSLKSICHC